MTATSMLPAPRVSADVERMLQERAEAKLIRPAREAGYEVRLLGATVLPQNQVITRTEWGTWMFVDHVDDPTATKKYRGKIPVPDEQRARLHDLYRVGVDPEYIVIGHELPATWQEGDPVPVPAPAHLREKDQRLVRWLSGLARVWAQGLAVILAAPAAPLAVLAAGAGMDPIVLGGVRHPTEPVVLWVLLAEWVWE